MIENPIKVWEANSEKQNENSNLGSRQRQVSGMQVFNATVTVQPSETPIKHD